MGSIKRYYAIAVTLGFILCLMASLRFNVWPAYKSEDYAAAVTMAAFVVLMAVIGVALPHAFSGRGGEKKRRSVRRSARRKGRGMWQKKSGARPRRPWRKA